MLYKKEFKELTAEELRAVERDFKDKTELTLQDLEFEYNKNLKEGERVENLLCD